MFFFDAELSLTKREQHKLTVWDKDFIIWHSLDHASWHILIIKANEMHYFSTLFGKELYMFWTDLLFIIRSLNTVFTAIGICHTGYVDEVRNM
jgi:hypothetical protein